MKRRRGTEVAGSSEFTVYPLGHYEMLSLPDATVHAPGGGILVLKNENFFVGQYATHIVDTDDTDPTHFHTIDAILDVSRGRHRTLSLFSSSSDRPVAGGWHTFQAASVYGYRLVETERTTLTVGAGLALSDFGIESADGEVWPLLPVPFIEGSFNSRALAVSFDFITGPNLNVTIAPENDLNMTVDARIDQFRSVEDLIFEASVAYRPFSIGIANTTFSYDLAKERQTRDVGSYVAFGKVDLTVFTVTGGYAFSSWERLDDEIERNDNTGFYLSIDVLLPLGGGDE